MASLATKTQKHIRHPVDYWLFLLLLLLDARQLLVSCPSVRFFKIFCSPKLMLLGFCLLYRVKISQKCHGVGAAALWGRYSRPSDALASPCSPLLLGLFLVN